MLNADAAKAVSSQYGPGFVIIDLEISLMEEQHMGKCMEIQPSCQSSKENAGEDQNGEFRLIILLGIDWIHTASV